MSNSKKINNNQQFYLGDPNLPTPNATFNYTPEMVREIKKCGSKIRYFAENYFYITTLAEGKQKIKLYRPQRRLLKSLVKHRFVVLLSSRQVGKTTMTTIYALWVACFQSDKRILIIANKEDTAIMILRRIRMAYEQLPEWLKPGVKQYGKTEIIFGNDSSIGISTTTASAARGEAANCITGENIITLKDKKTKKIFDVPIKYLADVLEKDNIVLDLDLV